MKRNNQTLISLVTRTLIKWSIPAMLMILLHSCSKDVPANANNEPAYALDKEVYFTIQTPSEIYSNYGFYEKSTNISAGQTINFQKALDSNGLPVLNIRISFSNELYFGGGGWVGPSTLSYLYLGNCQGEISMTKSGSEITGEYQSHPGNDIIYLINSSTQNKEQFFMDTTNVSFKITNEGRLTHGGDFVEGNFTFNLYSYVIGSSPFTANGSFKLVVN